MKVNLLVFFLSREKPVQRWPSHFPIIDYAPRWGAHDHQAGAGLHTAGLGQGSTRQYSAAPDPGLEGDNPVAASSSRMEGDNLLLRPVAQSMLAQVAPELANDRSSCDSPSYQLELTPQILLY